MLYHDKDKDKESSNIEGGVGIGSPFAAFHGNFDVFLALCRFFPVFCSFSKSVFCFPQIFLVSDTLLFYFFSTEFISFFRFSATF